MPGKKVTREDVIKLTNPMKERVKITGTASSSGPTTFSTNMAASAVNRNVTPGRQATRDNRFVSNRDYGRIGGGLR